MSPHVLVIVAGIVCLALAAFKVPATKFDFFAGGFAFLALSLLV